MNLNYYIQIYVNQFIDKQCNDHKKFYFLSMNVVAEHAFKNKNIYESF